MADFKLLPVSYCQVCMMPGYTIEAVIKSKNPRVLTRPELDHLMTLFQEVNPHRVPRAGETFQIPLFG